MGSSKPSIKEKAGNIRVLLDKGIEHLQVIQNNFDDDQNSFNEYATILVSAKTSVDRIYHDVTFQTPNLGGALNDLKAAAEDIVSLSEDESSLLRIKSRMGTAMVAAEALESQFPGHFSHVSNNTNERGLMVNSFIGDVNQTLRMFSKVDGNKTTDGVMINAPVKGDLDSLNRTFGSAQSWFGKPGKGQGDKGDKAGESAKVGRRTSMKRQ